MEAISVNVLGGPMRLALIIMTALKTLGYFASSAVMIPLRTGVVRDIRIEVYEKVLKLPLSFFSEERKGDIIARMSADVGAVENSITSSIDMLIRQPIAIIVCFATMLKGNHHIGEKVRVRITGSTSATLLGEIIEAE